MAGAWQHRRDARRPGLDDALAAPRAAGPILGGLIVHLVDVRGMLLFDAALAALMALLLTPTSSWSTRSVQRRSWTGVMAIMAATVSPERRGAAPGQIMFPFYIGAVIGPVVGGIAFHVGQGVVLGIAALLWMAPLVALVTMRPAVAQTKPA